MSSLDFLREDKRERLKVLKFQDITQEVDSNGRSPAARSTPLCTVAISLAMPASYIRAGR